MNILCHRGLWNSAAKQNTFGAFELSFSHNLGLELDVRDQHGELVISHDPVRNGARLFIEFLDLYRSLNQTSCLAINVKSDGLAPALRKALDDACVTNYFTFDMSFPEQLKYVRRGLNVYGRQSEYEGFPIPLYAQLTGVWMDCFESDWFDQQDISRHFDDGKSVCVVSPELHHRDYVPIWAMLKRSGLSKSDLVFLCTDLPLQALEYFRS